MSENVGEMYYGRQTYPKNNPFFLDAGIAIRKLSRQTADIVKGIVETSLEASKRSGKSLKKPARKTSEPSPDAKPNTGAAPKRKAKAKSAPAN